MVGYLWLPNRSRPARTVGHRQERGAALAYRSVGTVGRGYRGRVGFLWTSLAVVSVGFAICQVTTFATTVYLHRTVAHRAITMASGLAWTFRFVLWITTGQKVREWAAVSYTHLTLPTICSV